MIDLDTETIWEPPITIGLSLASLEDFKVPDYPCHTQGVERLVKETSSQSLKTCDQEKRNADIIIRLSERGKLKESIR